MIYGLKIEQFCDLFSCSDLSDISIWNLTQVIKYMKTK